MNTSKLNQTRLAAFVLLLSAAPLAHAASDININPSYNGNWGTRAVNGGSIVTAPTTGNTGTGITFADWDGNLVGTGAEFNTAQTMLVNLNATALPAAPIVNALFNTFYGVGNVVNATITFMNSLGATASFSLVGDQTIRDYNSGTFANDLQGYNTNSSYGQVTTQNWWTNGSGQKLDVSTFVLPTSWAGSGLASMTINNPYFASGSTDDTALSAVQVSSAVPEPASLRLLAVSLVGAGVAVNLRRRRLAAGAKKLTA